MGRTGIKTIPRPPSPSMTAGTFRCDSDSGDNSNSGGDSDNDSDDSDSSNNKRQQAAKKG